MENSFFLSPRQRDLCSGRSCFTRVEPPIQRGLLPGEERLWMLEQLEPTIHSFPVAFRMEGVLDVVALEQSLDKILQRHEGFRTSFKEYSGRVGATVEGSRPFTLLLIDLGSLLPDEREAHLRQVLEEESRRPLDLSRGHLLRARLLRLGPEEHVLLLVTHQIACDEESMAVLYAELAALYDSHAGKRLSVLPDLSKAAFPFSRGLRQQIESSEFSPGFHFWDRTAQQLG